VIRVVADTNVLASGLAAYDALDGPAASVLRAWQRRRFDLIASAPIFAELQRTLAKPYFTRRLETSGARQALSFIRHGAHAVSALTAVHGVATTPEDDLILATAVTGKAHVLVTGDRQLRNLGEYQGVRILGPRAFMDWLAANEGA
jgi:putative PIN family toxin of toxin-antitoxin system